MIPLSSFYDLLFGELPGAVPAFVDVQIRAVCRDFCARTDVWRDAFTPQDTAPGVGSYVLIPQAQDAEVSRPIRVEVNGVLLYDYADINGNVAEYPRRRAPFALSADRSTLTLIADEVPDAAMASGFVSSGSIQPTMGALVLPDFLFNQFGDEIRMGVLARMLVMGGKPWSDRALALDYRAEFDRSVMLAACEAARGNVHQQAALVLWNAADEFEARRGVATDAAVSIGDASELMTSTVAPTTGPTKTRTGSVWNYSLELSGVGAVSASAVVEVSHDGTDWLEWGTLSASGTDTALDTLEAGIGSYAYHRARLTAISGEQCVAEVRGGGA